MVIQNSIRHRITKAVLTICVITLLVSSFFSTFARYMLQTLLANSGREIGASASHMSADVLLEQSVSNSQDFVTVKVGVLDAYLDNVIDTLTVVRDFASSIYDAPGRFVPGNVPYYNRVPADVFAAYYTLDPHVALTPRIETEINLFASMIYPIETMIRLHGEVFSIYIATESGAVVFFDDTANTKRNLVESGTILRQRSWYLRAVETGSAVITDTYEDATRHGQIITFSIPVYRRNGELAGVIGADLRMRELSGVITDITSSGVEFAILLGKDHIIAGSIPGETEGANEFKFDEEEIFSNKNGVLLLTVSDIEKSGYRMNESYMIWDSLTHTDWKLVGFKSIASIVAPVEEMQANISVLTDKAVADAQRTAFATSTLTLLSLAGILFFGFSYAKKTSNHISSPLLSLASNAVKIGQGELDRLPDVETGDEIEALVNTINKMVADIKHITGEKERIGAELDVATNIQASMLPRTFPAFPNHNEFDIFASMKPAKEVGGDFYDFFLINENTLAVVIADVSDKGVPAALFMVVAKILIKNNAQEGRSPKEVFDIVNNLLCENNDTCMFVTSFFGYLDIPSGKFTYVNAGHNQPLIKTGEKFEWINTKPGLFLAGIEDFVYKEYSFDLKPGDELFFYTDGITEAVNNEFEQFGNDRLMETLNANLNLPLEEVNMLVKREIDLFADGAEQADDITMLALRYTKGMVTKTDKKPADKTFELTVEAKLENVDKVLDFVNDQLADYPPKICNQIGIAVDEIFSNIAQYAYTHAPLQQSSAVIRVTTGDEITIEFEDTGIPHNPLEAEDPDIDASIDEREPGGLGIFILKKIMDTVEYRRVDNRNILLIRKIVNKQGE